MNDNDLAFFIGTVVFLIGFIVFGVLALTQDLNPIERRARRVAILAAMATVTVTLGSVAFTFYYVSEFIGSFLAMPSLGITAVATWYTTRLTYCWMLRLES